MEYTGIARATRKSVGRASQADSSGHRDGRVVECSTGVRTCFQSSLYNIVREHKWAVVLTFRLCRGMMGEFSFDLHCFSTAGGERLCEEICVIKHILLMSGSLSIRL